MQRFRRNVGTMLLLGAVVCLAGVADAQIPNTISYQGILTNAAVPPVIVPDGNYNLAFKLYTASSGGSAFWTETHSNVPVAEGRFYVELGSLSPLTGVSFGAPYFLGITVNSGTELPRIPLTASAYSVNARRVATVDSATGGRITGNINLQTSTATVGNILKDGTLFLNDFGWQNTFIGLNAGNLTMSGYGNTASGNEALKANTSGNYNTATGLFALWKNTSGYSNTANGHYALASNLGGEGNTAVGDYALGYNTTGHGNTSVGKWALRFDTSGSENTAYGATSLASQTAGDDNTAIGARALQSTTTGEYNTACGQGALGNNTTGSYNTAIGKLAD